MSLDSSRPLIGFYKSGKPLNLRENLLHFITADAAIGFHKTAPGGTMGFGNILSSTRISASGLAAERLRMEIASNNIANINTTSTPEGGPYRRQVVQFGSVMDSLTAGQNSASGLGGVQVLGVKPDAGPLPERYDPGHPDAKENGFVTIPNIKMPDEMTDLMTASRAYEANMKSLTTFRKMAEQALSLMSPR